MTTWIAHLRISENLLRRRPDLDEMAFSVGSIAPDSGIPDEKWENFTPPPLVTHFKAPEGSRYVTQDLDFYRGYLAAFSKNNGNPQEYSFRLGYFSHLLADSLWADNIVKVTRERFQDQITANRDFMWKIKKDWYGLDFVYVRNHPQSLFWRVFLNCDYPVNYLDFLIHEGVRQRISYIKEYYQKQDEKTDELTNREWSYLTAQQMDTYIEQTSRNIDTIFDYLEGENTPPEGIHSALEIPLPVSMVDRQ